MTNNSASQMSVQLPCDFGATYTPEQLHLPITANDQMVVAHELTSTPRASPLSYATRSSTWGISRIDIQACHTLQSGFSKYSSKSEGRGKTIDILVCFTGVQSVARPSVTWIP